MFVNQSGDPSCACFFLGSCEKKNTSASPFSFFTQYMLQRVFLSAFPSCGPALRRLPPLSSSS